MSVVLYMSMSVDGFIAGPDDDLDHGLGVGGEPLHAWLAAGDGSPGSHRPESGPNATVFDEMIGTGAVITGRRTFELAARGIETERPSSPDGSEDFWTAWLTEPFSRTLPSWTSPAAPEARPQLRTCPTIDGGWRHERAQREGSRRRDVPTAAGG